MDALRDRIARARSARDSEAGTTLVEMLVAVAILSIAAVAILAGLQLSVTTSDIQRKQTSGGTLVRNYAEAINAHVSAGDYAPGCTDASAEYAPGSVGYTPPASFTAAVTSVQAVDGAGADTSCAPGSDYGVQRLTVEVGSNDGRATEYLTFVVRRP